MPSRCRRSRSRVASADRSSSRMFQGVMDMHAPRITGVLPGYSEGLLAHGLSSRTIKPLVSFGRESGTAESPRGGEEYEHISHYHRDCVDQEPVENPEPRATHLDGTKH